MKIFLLFILFSFSNASRNLSDQFRDDNNVQEGTTTTILSTIAIRINTKIENPDEIAKSHGFINRGLIANLKDYYLFEYVINANDNDNDRFKRSIQRAKRAVDAISRDSRIEWMEEQQPKQRFTRDLPTINDPLFPLQWHLKSPELDNEPAGANIINAWQSYSITGKGVVLAIVDDGLEYNHPDLQGNFYESASKNVIGSGSLPTPSYYDTHGTSAAGVAGAANDGTSCGVGVAKDVSLAGIRLISRAVTDFEEATALSYQSDSVIDIYSCSWGPSDNGKTLCGPSKLTVEAMQQAFLHGRSNLGVIYVWAAGNGRENKDSCAYDGYVNLPYTLAVGAVGRTGVAAYYSEACPAVFVSAPSSDDRDAIVTTDLANSRGSSGGDCRQNFGGTSAAAPLVAGVIALILEANPTLTARDVQQVLVSSARRIDPNSGSWICNAAGVWHSDLYGFGLVDAMSAIESATKYDSEHSLMSDKQIIISSGEIFVNVPIPDNGDESWISVESAAFADLIIEYVQVEVTITHRRRGELEFEIVSPQGTVSKIPARKSDYNANFDKWKFGTYKSWNEHSPGKWNLRIRDTIVGNSGIFKSWGIEIYGRY